MDLECKWTPCYPVNFNRERDLIADLTGWPVSIIDLNLEILNHSLNFEVQVSHCQPARRCLKPKPKNLGLSRFKKATMAVKFTNNLKRVSMLKTRAPKEFSLVERVARMEEVGEKFAALEESIQSQIEEQDTKILTLEDLTTKGFVIQSIQALGRRVQSMELNSR